MDTAGSLEVKVSVTNTGRRDGVEVVQLYASDPVASVTRPTTQLIGFARVPLSVGETATIGFEVHTDRLSFTSRDLGRIVSRARSPSGSAQLATRSLVRSRSG